jgi:hypothetical protein
VIVIALEPGGVTAGSALVSTPVVVVVFALQVIAHDGWVSKEEGWGAGERK